MAIGLKKDFFPVLIKWIKANQITVVIASTTIALIGIVITVLLLMGAYSQRETTKESLVNLAGLTASEIQSNYMSYYNIVHTASQVMENYKNIEVDVRRSFINKLLLEILESNPSLVNVYSVWKPNELDGMDEHYANTPGTDHTGQFISGFTRVQGAIKQRAFPDFRDIFESGYSSSGLVSGAVGEPFPTANESGYNWLVDLSLPVVVEKNVVGIVGITINLEMFQLLCEARGLYRAGRTMICTGRGTLIAHTDAELRGGSFMVSGLNLNEHEPLFNREFRSFVFERIQNSIGQVDPIGFIHKDTMIVTCPLRTIDPLTAAYNANEPGFPNWVVVAAVPMSEILAPINASLRFSVIFIIGAGIVIAFVVLATSRTLTQKAKILQRSLEQSTTMQDNLKYGLFLMDQKFIIQGAYSKALEKILSLSNLEGKNFIDLLSSSVKDSEKQGIADYFEMVFKNAFDKELLDSINPINDFVYVSIETRETKNLRTSFTLAGQGRGALYILGNMEDITAEKELQRQLLEAESIRENEMRSIFQIIQIDPRVLRDFVVDAEYEFERINELLRNKKQVQHEVLVEMYQSVHAIKSNALILNLEDFSEMLHKFEDSVRVLREDHKEEIPFDELLSLILQLDNAMKELDRLKATVSKIENFKFSSGGEKNQERYVLVETLTRVCNKTQAALDKKVRFVVEGIDDIVLDYGPRRDIKEILTQLVRNAVYHGIERPEERTPLGKEAEGEIRLSIRYRENQIIIKLADNGAGIDFGRIRQAAEANNMFHNDDEANDKNYLLKTIFSPGFSTLDQADFHAGRGVGLSLVKDRIKDLHGNITVSTAKGKGTSFTITIPLELRDPAADNVS